ncbi:hypothetical protein BT69DRAFT_1298171 [Atractiella rhizophila]|nr:hypothetical protein BT69DRAFT_1298171 [Atractiella rhizophila]
MGGGLMYKNLAKDKRHKKPRRIRYHKAMMRQRQLVGLQYIALWHEKIKRNQDPIPCASIFQGWREQCYPGYAIKRFAVQQLASHLQILAATYIAISPHAFLRTNKLFKFIQHAKLYKAPLWDSTSSILFSTGLVLIFNNLSSRHVDWNNTFDSLDPSAPQAATKGATLWMILEGWTFEFNSDQATSSFFSPAQRLTGSRTSLSARASVSIRLPTEKYRIISQGKWWIGQRQAPNLKTFENQAAANERFKAKEFELQEAKAVFVAKRAIRISNDWNSAAKKNLKRKR